MLSLINLTADARNPDCPHAGVAGVGCWEVTGLQSQGSQVRSQNARLISTLNFTFILSTPADPTRTGHCAPDCASHVPSLRSEGHRGDTKVPGLLSGLLCVHDPSAMLRPGLTSHSMMSSCVFIHVYTCMYDVCATVGVHVCVQWVLACTCSTLCWLGHSSPSPGIVAPLGRAA